MRKHQGLSLYPPIWIMNKRELVDRLCEDLGTTKSAAEEIVDKVLRAIQEGVQRDGEVALIGFGSWHLRERASRNGRHPSTGQAISIPAGQSVVFKPARAWRDGLMPAGIEKLAAAKVPAPAKLKEMEGGA